MSAMYNFLFDKKSLALLIAGLVLGGGMLFFAGVLVGVYWSLPYGESIQATAPPRRPLPPTAAAEPAAAPPPAAPEPVAARPSSLASEPPVSEGGEREGRPERPAPLATEPPIELPVSPPPASETAGPVAGAEESIGLPRSVPAPAPDPTPAPALRAEAPRPRPARRPRQSEAPASPEPVLAVDSGEGRYTIQVGAYSEAANSEETVTQLSRRGYSPYVVEVHGTRGVLRLVRVGRYPDRGTATRAASELRRKARMEAIVAPVISKAKEAAPESAPAEGGEKPATSG